MDEPGIRSALLVWVVLPYVLAGLVAWSRRPESRFGPLMVLAGFATFLSGLQWSNHALPYTVGLVFDIVVAAIFLHVFLAFPSGRLERRTERRLVVLGYSVAIVLQIAKMLLGGGGPDNLIAIVTEPAAANTVEDVQLLTMSAICLAGIVLLARRRRSTVRPLRPWVSLLVDSFALGLVGMAVLLVAGSFAWPSFVTIQRITFGVIGLAPIAFLIGLLNARLARSNVTTSSFGSMRTRRPRSCPGCSPTRCATRRSRSPTGCPSSARGRISRAVRWSCRERAPPEPQRSSSATACGWPPLSTTPPSPRSASSSRR